ncbi:hypothetical protein [Marinobacter flavimaris]|uniref:hypothetical protein n=1 Tax=Marinobacter flavimaris TaxID=262076 RepID=UPI0038635FFA
MTDPRTDKDINKNDSYSAEQYGFVDYATRKVKTIANKPWQQSFPFAKLCNVKTLIILLIAYLSLRLPVLSIFGETVSIYEMESEGGLSLGLFHFWLFLAAASFAIGAPKLVAKTLLAFSLLSFCSPFYDVITELTNLNEQTGGFMGRMDFSDIISGWAIVVLLGIITFFVPFFIKQETNNSLWKALADIYREDSVQPAATADSNS